MNLSCCCDVKRLSLFCSTKAVIDRMNLGIFSVDPDLATIDAIELILNLPTAGTSR